MYRGGIGILVALSMLIGASASEAATETVTCANLASAMNSASDGDVLQLTGATGSSPPCQINATVSNDASFTLESAPGGEAVLEPSNTSENIIGTQSPTDPHFTLQDLEFTRSHNSAVTIGSSSSGAGVTIKDDLFVNDGSITGPLGGGLELSNSGTSSAEVSSIVGNKFIGDQGYAGGGFYAENNERLVLSGNTFAGDSAEHTGGGFLLAGWSATSTNPVTVADNTVGGSSTTAGNSAVEGGGAAIALSAGQPLTLADNLFENDNTAGTPDGPNFPYAEADGGGLFLGTQSGSAPFPVTQSHNTFIDDTDGSSSSTDRYGGGGEWVQGLTVQSTQDRFIDDRVSVNGGGTGVPGGGGLGVLDAAAEYSEPALAGAFVGRDDYFSGDTSVAGGWGGAIYVGFDTPGPTCTGTCPGSSVTLLDSTVTGNHVDTASGSEGGAIWGDAYDNLKLENSIVYGNAPQPEIWGFGSAHPTFESDDVCTEPGGPSITGSGSICAGPKLNPNGTETAASPTVDAGSNALVPAGLTTDAAGKPRIVANRLTCTGSAPPLVDMGAFEATFKIAPASCPSAKVTIGSGKLSDKKGKAGVKLSCPHGFEFCQGTVSLTTLRKIRPPAHKGKKGKKAKRGKSRKLKLGRASFKISTGKTRTIKVTLSKSVLSELKKLHFKSVRVLISVSDHDAKGDKAKSSAKRTLTLPGKHHKKKKH